LLLVFDVLGDVADRLELLRVLIRHFDVELLSKAITSSTISSESAPKSSMKEACGVTCSGLTPSCSTMMSLTFSSNWFVAHRNFVLSLSIGAGG
jgi:hypothetical protein